MQIITWIGRYPWVLLPIWAVWMVKADRPTRRSGWALLVAVVFSDVLVNEGLKPWIARPRPHAVLENVRLIFTAVDDLTEFSFPSAHAANSVTAAVFLSWIVPQKKWIALFIAAAGLSAFSRVYIGVHYPSDVLGGALLGSVIGTVGNFRRVSRFLSPK